MTIFQSTVTYDVVFIHTIIFSSRSLSNPFSPFQHFTLNIVTFESGNTICLVHQNPHQRYVTESSHISIFPITKINTNCQEMLFIHYSFDFFKVSDFPFTSEIEKACLASNIYSMNKVRICDS